MPRRQIDIGHFSDEMANEAIDRNYDLVCRRLETEFPERGRMACAAIHIAERLMQYGERNKDYTPLVRLLDHLSEIE